MAIHRLLPGHGRTVTQLVTQHGDGANRTAFKEPADMHEFVTRLDVEDVRHVALSPLAERMPIH
jgi:hypothetical protein